MGRCTRPIKAWQPIGGGQVIFVERRDHRELKLPCGQCMDCRLERSRQWAVRCVHESQMHDANCFVTLTYDPVNIPQYGSLQYRDFQLFMKRLRKRFPRDKKDGIRFYMCGEYGEQNGRPHYHACLFNMWFPDSEFYRELPSGSRLYTSKILEELWPFGFCSVGMVTFESAAYVARYCAKKVTGVDAELHYMRVLPDGECIWIEPEFNHMSLKPGIGARWLDKYSAEVYPSDTVAINGSVCKPPKYYDKKIQEENPELIEDVSYSRYLSSLKYVEEGTPQRLAVREKVTAARLKFKVRGLE